jgi:hypothetical protein
LLKHVLALGVAFAVVSSAIASPAAAQQLTVTAEESRLRAIIEIMSAMSAESRLASARIREAYRDELDSALRDRPALIRSLEAGELARVPENPARFNLDLRLAGAHPIAERDLVYQPLYIAARPATVGALMAVAARVESGPIEVTSLVRHHEYQQALRRTNPNAVTGVPTHTMGLAFDISVINMPVETVLDIRDVLRAMSDAGDLFVVAETRQLVFHVVPAPGRLAFFNALYDAVMMLSPDVSRAIVVAQAPQAAESTAAGADDGMD